MSVEAVDVRVVVTGATAAGVVVLSPHAIADAVMTNAATTRRIELFTLAAIVIG
ncbi:MAG TPA: hypothetical protein VM282_04710 [Acidimicrobiales bacterium]|nr:hypothetical protein [Acidimicrobiales bacterium]